MSTNNFCFGWRGFFSTVGVNRILQLAYMEFGHTSGAFINLVTNWPGDIELHNGGAFGTSTIHSARLSCRPYKSFSSSATHTHAKELSAVL